MTLAPPRRWCARSCLRHGRRPVRRYRRGGEPAGDRLDGARAFVAGSAGPGARAAAAAARPPRRRGRARRGPGRRAAGWRTFPFATQSDAYDLALGPGGSVYTAGAAGTPDRPFVARHLPNAAPIAALNAAATATAGAPVTLDAGGSSDPEGEPLQYAFDLDGNGSFEFDGGANPFAATSFAAPGTYTLGVRVTDPRGASATAARSVAVSAAQTPPPQPLLSQQGVARPISGVIRIRLPGTKKFVRITELTAIPNGTEIDARKGRVLITVLHDATGRLDAAKFYAGRFIFTQGKGAVPLTTLRLSGGSFAGCGRKAKARRSLLAVAVERPERRQEEAGPQAVGRRAREVPHARQVGRGDGARHEVAHAGPLRRHARSRSCAARSTRRTWSGPSAGPSDSNAGDAILIRKAG